jgi:hypothetical protein
MAEMSAFTPPPKRPLQRPSAKAPAWAVAVIGLLVVAILVVILMLVGVI